ncbi:MAG: hypothetical protein ABSG84_16135 [Acidobacteriaceae bacterium]|jgi:hypothetical protein
MAFGDDALSFPHNWRAEVLSQPPLIAPARQFTYPRQVAGEEDALARGALLVLVHPSAGGDFLATCALGFTDPAMPTGIFACPNPRELCAIAGGYAYVIDTAAPDCSTHIPLKPVTEVLVLAAQGLLVFVGFHTIVAWGREGLAWQTTRLSWEGIRIVGIGVGADADGAAAGTPYLHGLGWNLASNKEVEFAVNLRTGAHTGGGF